MINSGQQERGKGDTQGSDLDEKLWWSLPLKQGLVEKSSWGTEYKMFVKMSWTENASLILNWGSQRHVLIVLPGEILGLTKWNQWNCTSLISTSQVKRIWICAQRIRKITTPILSAEWAPSNLGTVNIHVVTRWRVYLLTKVGSESGAAREGWPGNRICVPFPSVLGAASSFL